ncbi:hypothetical protein [Clostridium tertium]|uniref:hypothetical protein n=1 Tax=Clostridium tertium TaxID=1559 RepID=UPI00291B8F84|nr:hypothetical protein [Clostridium sp.]
MKKFIIPIITIILILTNTRYVQADMGPKPSLKIIVKNAPEEEYYLDLLVDYPADNGYIWLDESRYDSEKLQILSNYRDGNWRAAKVTGTRVPLTGELIGISNKNEMIHDFGYVGVPDIFRIIIVTSDNEIVTSDIIETNTFNSVVYYDFENSELRKESIIFDITFQFLFTCICTLIIEGIILKLFKFKLKENYKPFFIINIGTQLFLNLIIITITLKHGVLGGFLIYPFLEIPIFISEIILFRKYLRPQNKKRITLYALFANTVSFIAGILLIL